MLRISLIGNPNVGKTSLYNRITRSFEHVGNWHGVTVDKKEKNIVYKGNEIVVRDLPGLYSLSVYSPEEAISRDCVLGGDNDLVICVCDVNNLSRNLFLALQLMELNCPLLIAVNMMDELYSKGGEFDFKQLERRINVPVIALSASNKKDVERLMDTCINIVNVKMVQNPRLDYVSSLPVKNVLPLISSNAKNAGLNCCYAALKVLESDEFVLARLNLDTNKTRLIEPFKALREDVAAARYGYIDSITRGTIILNKKTYINNLNALDKIILNKYLALPFFLIILGLIFFITFGFLGNLLSNGLTVLLNKYVHLPVVGYLKNAGVDEWIYSLLGEGIILGMGGVMVFLPQIVMLFLFLSLLEDSGYISRVAFMSDALFKKIGLSGRSVFTMLMGFGCSATAILTARGLEDELTRKKTVILTPFMSCSARLPVYSAIAGSFFKLAPLAVFLIYLLGAVFAVLTAAAMQGLKCTKSGRLSFIMEMPPYRLPTIERLSQLVFNNVKVFLIRVGTVIFALNVIVWILSNFSLSVGFLSKGQVNDGYQSLMQTFASLIAPIFKPLGLNDWRAVAALLSGLIAKEAVISSIESLGGVNAVLSFDPLNAVCFLTFTLLYVPCVATIAAIFKEAGMKWALFSLVLQLSLAYLTTFIVRCLAIIFVSHYSLALGTIILLLVAFIAFLNVKRLLKPSKRCYNEQCSNCMECL